MIPSHLFNEKAELALGLGLKQLTKPKIIDVKSVDSESLF